jgi:chromosome segregation ATPase
VFEHARHERERNQGEWRNKMREALERKREQAEKLRGSIEHDEGNVSRWQDTIYNLRPGGRADEIRDDLESRISDVEDRIRSKRRRVEELEESIRDIEARLYR